LITGGATGIGFALAQRFAAAGSHVVICGRRPDALEKAREAIAGLETIRCDVANEHERIELFDRAVRDFPDLNVLINNAGVQVRSPKYDEGVDWSEIRQEIEINFAAPVHLASLFVPYLVKKADSAIVNITSGLAFVPISFLPSYCATKAAMHSFTLSLRHQLIGTPTIVIEIAPPAVNTDLGGPGLHTAGVPLDEFADDAFRRLELGETEFGYESSERRRLAGRSEFDAIFKMMNPVGG
jgi:uncharacterized oxidoreductase